MTKLRALLNAAGLAAALWVNPGMTAEPAGNAAGFGDPLSAGKGSPMQNPTLYLELIQGMQQKRLHYAALAHLDAFDSRWPARPEAALLRADALRETGQPEAAKAIYQPLLKGPLAAGAYHGLGLIAVRAGDLAGGAAALGHAAALAPTDVGVLNDQGYTLLLLNDLAAAKLALFKAAELDAGNKRVGANLALYFYLDGQAEQARQVIQRYGLPARIQEDIRRKAEKGRGG